ncbi:uncharacterized protein LOC131240464 isoform X2 [Magnolia sinica]|uniref:uncharacterized protein LOC131240464 isoform X2 n=1 Tax=Magnolia sinica TaxID=86752 RepID=UPI00265AA487|nr:uncharacterized protein LOC131240464 isoform X2 [Magnolia sinica]
MKSKRAAVRQFGQLSLPSSFHSNSIPSSKDRKDDTSSKPLTSCISLSDFLDRKLDKTTQKLIQEKQKSFSTVAIGPVNEHMGLKREESGADFFLNRAVFQHFKHKLNEGDCVRSSGGGELGVFELELTEDREDLRKRKNPFAVSRGGDERDSHQGRLVVLGDDPKPKQRGRGNMFTSKRPKNLFNHYANGSGWWDCNMEGVDSEEVGCSEAWEGMGSTTLGGLEWH